MSLTPEQCSFGASIAAHSMHAVHDSTGLAVFVLVSARNRRPR